jgi:hypothetical protein
MSSLCEHDRVEHNDRPDAPHDVLAAEEFPLGAGDPALHAEDAHDVLAADAFPLGAGDPALHVEHAHDVLAADEFPVGGADPVLEHVHHTGAEGSTDDPSGRPAARATVRVLLGAAALATFAGAVRRAARRKRSAGT